MATEKEKMIAGEMYVPLDPVLTEERQKARLLFKALNKTGDDEKDKRQEILSQLLPNSQPDLWIEPPFYCDYDSLSEPNPQESSLRQQHPWRSGP